MVKRSQSLQGNDPEAICKLCDWIEVHTLSLHQATHAAICDHQPSDTTEGFDCKAFYMLFQLTDRPDADGDPIKLYRLEGAGLRPIAELCADSETTPQGVVENQSGEGGDADPDPSGNAAIRRNFIDSLDDYDAKERATLPPHKIPCYVGTIACCYQILTQRNMSVMACYHLTDDKDFFEAVERGVIPGVANIPPARHDLWFARLQNRVELGHCFGPELSVPMKLMQGLGKMVRRRPGGKWTWEMLTPEESLMYGYQFIVCGLLY